MVETLTTERMMLSGTNSPPAEVQYQPGDSNKTVDI